MRQNVLSVYLVVQQVEAVSRFVLRLAIQLDLKFPNVTRCCQTHRQSPHLSSFTSTPEVRVLSSAGVTRPQWSYNPLRLPDWPSPLRATFGGATSTSPGYPPLAQITFSACRAHYPGGPEQVLVGSFPVRAAFPVLQAGRHPHRHFEACSSFTRVTACTVARPPYVGFIARLRPSQFPDSDARKLSSPTNNYLSGSFPHW